MRLTTGEQLAALAGLVPQDETVAENWTVAHERIAELEALIQDVAETSSSSRLRRLSKQALANREWI